MEFFFEVNPDLDLAVGTELSFEAGIEEELGQDGLAFSGMDPLTPTGAKPGSEDKVKMLAARYAAGVPLWHDEDCYDHGPAHSGFDNEDTFGLHEDEDDF